MSCILYSKGAYLQLQSQSKLAREIASNMFQQPLAEFLFELNADAYAVRYGHHDSIGSEIDECRANVLGDYEFELTDWNDPAELHKLFKRIEYQCSDILTSEDPENPRYLSLVAMREELERRMVHPIYVAEAQRKQLAAQAEAAVAYAGQKEQFIKELREQYPWAKAPNASKNLKKELTLAFPGVKFSVRSPHYGSVSVYWIDGPSTDQVDAIANKYKRGSFDGMVDSYDYDRSAYGEAVSDVLGRSQYVSTSRSFSPRFLMDATLETCMEYNCDELPLVKAHNDGSAYVDGGNQPYCQGAYDSLKDLIYRFAYKSSTFTLQEAK